MAKKKIKFQTNIIADIYSNIEEKVFDFLSLTEYIFECDAWMMKKANHTYQFEDIDRIYEYFENEHPNMQNQYFKKHSKLEKMTYYASIKKHNALYNEFMSYGMTPTEIFSLNWNDCPERFLIEKRGENPNDYMNITAHNTRYEFNGNSQRIIVKYLHEKTEKNETARARELLDLVKSDCTKLRDLFNNGKHPAFNTLIVQEPEGSGNWKLNI